MTLVKKYQRSNVDLTLIQDAFVPHWSSPLSNPLGLVFGPDDNLYVASRNSSQVLRYNGTTGQFIDVFAYGNELIGPFGLVFGADSNLYVTDISNDYVLRYEGITGDFIDIFAAGGGLDTPTFLIFSPLEYLTVNIDIKPGSYPNSINPRSKGKIPVAIISTMDFDAPTEVDTESLTFGPTGDEESLAFCSPSSEDVNDDGYDDLVCHFYTWNAEFQCGNSEGILIGKTVDETSSEGSDSVRIVPSACR